MNKKKLLFLLIPGIFLLLFNNLRAFQRYGVQNGGFNQEIESGRAGIYQLFGHESDRFIIIESIFCLIVSVIMSLTIIYVVNKRNEIRHLISLRKVIFNLAKNDFKTKYTGSYLGVTWAFAQPIVTIMLYWFVFQVGFRTGSVEGFPFALWLIACMIPWFFFSDAISAATNSMVEYSYLVKKVVFQISMLPIVKILSALFVHLFFLVLLIFIYSINGVHLSIHIMQLLYYSLCAFILALGISYLTSAIVPFFKDLSQIVAILLQIAMWMTPILWNFEMIPIKYQWVLKINPVYYVVEGYRDTLMYHIWFFERFNQTIYFWTIVIGIFVIGMVLFKKLRPHFSDVL